MKKGTTTTVILTLVVLGLVVFYFIVRPGPVKPVINVTTNTSQQTEAMIGITAEHLCSDGQVKDRSFTGTEYVFSSCHALPNDYKKTCSSSIDCTNHCVTTLDLATATGCVEADNKLKEKCSMTGFCSATYDSGGFIELVSGVPTQRFDK